MKTITNIAITQIHVSLGRLFRRAGYRVCSFPLSDNVLPSKGEVGAKPVFSIFAVTTVASKSGVCI